MHVLLQEPMHLDIYNLSCGTLTLYHPLELAVINNKLEAMVPLLNDDKIGDYFRISTANPTSKQDRGTLCLNPKYYVEAVLRYIIHMGYNYICLLLRR